MAFVEIERGRWGSAAKIPNNIVRLNKSSISISPNIGETFQLGRETLETGSEKVTLGVAVDKEAKQIKLLPSSLNGYAWHSRNGDEVLRWQTNKRFKSLGLMLGDYELVDRNNLVFQLAE